MKKAHSIHDAKTQLSRLVERAEGGEEVIIARGSTLLSTSPCSMPNGLEALPANTAIPSIAC